LNPSPENIPGLGAMGYSAADSVISDGSVEQATDWVSSEKMLVSTVSSSVRV
jgi:hypothetical protein